MQVFIIQHISFNEQIKFHARLSWAWKKFNNLRACFPWITHLIHANFQTFWKQSQSCQGMSLWLNRIPLPREVTLIETGTIYWDTRTITIYSHGKTGENITYKVDSRRQAPQSLQCPHINCSRRFTMIIFQGLIQACLCKIQACLCKIQWLFKDFWKTIFQFLRTTSQSLTL